MSPPLPVGKPEAPDVAWSAPPASTESTSSGGTLTFSDVAASLGGAAVASGEDGGEERFRVRIASYRDRDSVTANWDRLYSEHRDLFGGMEAVITEVVVSGQPYYRLQVGDFATKEGAESLCGALHERGLECLVAPF